MDELLTLNNIIASDMLKRISLSHTAKGILFKWTTIIYGKKYYYKSGKLSYGIFKSLEPVNECIACKIGKLLGIDCVEYDLEKIHVSESDEYEE